MEGNMKEGTIVQCIGAVIDVEFSREHLPKIYDASRVDRVVDMHQDEAEDIMRRLAREEGIFCGVSSGGAVAAMLRLSRELENAVLVAIICDRGDRYLSSGVYDPR